MRPRRQGWWAAVSSTNAMAYVRGNPPRLRPLGCPPGPRGWSYDEVLPYFRRSERWEGGPSGLPRRRRAARRADLPPTRTPLNRRGSPTPARRPVTRGPTTTTAMCKLGFSRLQMTIGEGPALELGHRLSAPGLAAAEPSGSKVNALAKRILIEGGRATGIEYQQGGGRPDGNAPTAR